MMYQISVYVPKDSLDAVKKEMFNAGAGRLGNYESCAWQTKGTGQFKPLAGANPSLGKISKLTHVSEYKLEVLCDKAHLSATVVAMKKAHPYEVVAYGVIALFEI